MIIAFLLNRILARSVAEVAWEGWFPGSTGRDGRIKGRDVRLGRVVGFQGFARRVRDVREKSAMCAIAIFGVFPIEIAPRGLSSDEP